MTLYKFASVPCSAAVDDAAPALRPGRAGADTQGAH